MSDSAAERTMRLRNRRAASTRHRNAHVTHEQREHVQAAGAAFSESEREQFARQLMDAGKLDEAEQFLKFPEADFQKGYSEFLKSAPASAKRARERFTKQNPGIGSEQVRRVEEAPAADVQRADAITRDMDSFAPGWDKNPAMQVSVRQGLAGDPVHGHLRALGVNKVVELIDEGKIDVAEGRAAFPRDKPAASGGVVRDLSIEEMEERYRAEGRKGF